MKRELKKNQKTKISIPIILFRIISLIIIIIALYYLYEWYLENKENEDIINDIRSQVSFTEINEENESEDSSNTLLNFTDLINQNQDTVAWIKINNTSIDFPVVKSSDNEYYLKHNFYKEYNSAGWIFADYRNKFDDTDKNIIIYGHNRRNGSMFSTLNNILEESWYTNSENHIVTLYTPTKTHSYQVFSIYKIKATNFDNSIDFPTNEEYQDFINNSINNSIYNFNINVTSSDKILTVYTCANNNQYRIILQAKEI